LPGVGDHDDRSRLGELGSPPHQVDARHAGQADGDHREDDTRLADQLERILGGAGGQRAVAPLRQQREDTSTLIGISLDDQDCT